MDVTKQQFDENFQFFYNNLKAGMLNQFVKDYRKAKKEGKEIKVKELEKLLFDYGKVYFDTPAETLLKLLNS